MKRHRTRVNVDKGQFSAGIHEVVVSVDGPWAWTTCACGFRKSAGIGGEELASRIAVEHLAREGYTPTMIGSRWGDR